MKKIKKKYVPYIRNVGVWFGIIIIWFLGRFIIFDFLAINKTFKPTNIGELFNHNVLSELQCSFFFSGMRCMAEGGLKPYFVYLVALIIIVVTFLLIKYKKR